MLFIFGTTLRDRVIAVVRFVCNYCQADASQDVIENATKVSFFFIPLFTVGRRYVNVCSNCGATTPLTKEQATNGMEWAVRNRQLI